MGCLLDQGIGRYFGISRHDVRVIVAGEGRAFRAFEQDAKHFADFAQNKLTIPMSVLTGEKASGSLLIEETPLVDSNVEGVVIKGSGIAES
jgi:hypothetical protein